MGKTCLGACPSRSGIRLPLPPPLPGPVLRGCAPGIGWPRVARAARATENLKREIRAAHTSGTLPADYQMSRQGCADWEQASPRYLWPGCLQSVGEQPEVVQIALYVPATHTQGCPIYWRFNSFAWWLDLKGSRQHRPLQPPTTTITAKSNDTPLPSRKR